jgi:hypothetical protein
MGNVFSGYADDEGSLDSTDDSSDDGRNAKAVALTTDAFGTFDGTPGRWIPFKERVLGKAGAAGYDAIFQERCQLKRANRNANKRIFYLLKLATTGGGASALVNRHEQAQNGHGAWQALLTYYEGPIAANEAAKLTRAHLFNLRLRPKDDATLYMNNFNMYTDQLIKLKRPEAEETLVDMFLDSILDDKYDVTKNLCRQLKYKTVAECMEAVRFANNAAIRDSVIESGDTVQHLRTKLRRLQDGSKTDTTPGGDNPTSTKLAPTSGPGRYYKYSEWQALTPEQRKEILLARGAKRTPRRAKTKPPPSEEPEVEPASTP